MHPQTTRFMCRSKKMYLCFHVLKQKRCNHYSYFSGFSNAVIKGSARILLSDCFPSEFSSFSQGIYQNSNSMGMGLGSLIGGLLIGRFGAKSTFFATGMSSFVIAAVFLLGIIMKKTHQYDCTRELTSSQETHSINLGHLNKIPTTCTTFQPQPASE